MLSNTFGQVGRCCALVLSAALTVAAAGSAAPALSGEQKTGEQKADETEDAAGRLAQRLSTIVQFDATFTQTLFGSRGEILQRSTGALVIERPRRFRWSVDVPFPQTIVTVGERIYIHDPDLDQVTIRRLDESLDGTPAMILAGDPGDIVAGFEVAHESTTRGDQFVLTPRREQSLYGEMHMFFGAANLERLEILDSFGQMTEVSFADVRLNESIDPAVFSFEIPAGAEVIDDVGDAAPQ